MVLGEASDLWSFSSAISGYEREETELVLFFSQGCGENQMKSMRATPQTLFSRKTRASEFCRHCTYLVLSKSNLVYFLILGP